MLQFKRSGPPRLAWTFKRSETTALPWDRHPVLKAIHAVLDSTRTTLGTPFFQTYFPDLARGVVVSGSAALYVAEWIVHKKEPDWRPGDINLFVNVQVIWTDSLRRALERRVGPNHGVHIRVQIANDIGWTREQLEQNKRLFPDVNFETLQCNAVKPDYMLAKGDNHNMFPLNCTIEADGVSMPVTVAHAKLMSRGPGYLFDMTCSTPVIDISKTGCLKVSPGFATIESLVKKVSILHNSAIVFHDRLVTRIRKATSQGYTVVMPERIGARGTVPYDLDEPFDNLTLMREVFAVVGTDYGYKHDTDPVARVAALRSALDDAV